HQPVHREFATPALVLRTRPYGESDRIVTLITEQHGKVSGIAKGAKNSRRRFAGTLEPFVHIQAVFRQRTTSDLAFLLRCELLGVWRELARLAARPLDEAGTATDARVLREAAAVAEALIGSVAAGPVHAREFITRARVDSPQGVR